LAAFYFATAAERIGTMFSAAFGGMMANQALPSDSVAVIGKNNLGRVTAFQRHSWHVFEHGHAIGNVRVPETVAFPRHFGAGCGTFKSVAQGVADIVELFLAWVHGAGPFGVKSQPRG
jgi:hypothetical protein